METHDPDTTAAVPEPPPVVQPVPPPPLPQHRIYGKREAAVVHERSVRPRIELPEEDELFVHSQLQSFREPDQEHVSDHGVEGIGACTVFANSVGENLKTTSKDDSHLHRVSDDQGVELTFDVSWNDLDKFQSKTEFLTQSHRFNNSQKCRGDLETAGSEGQEGIRSCKIR